MSVEDAVDDDRAVAQLVRLAREKLQGDPPRREQASFHRLEARLGNARAERRTRYVWTGSLAAAAAFAVLVGWYALRPSDLTYRVDSGQVGSDGSVVAGANTHIFFSDGSEVALEPGSHTQIAELEPKGGRVRLDNGGAHVAIARKPGAAWSVEAGPYTVRVTGTAFDVRWSGAQQRFEIAMEHGSVVVTGPYTGTGVTLRAGQRLVGGVAEGRVTVDQVGTRPNAQSGAVAATGTTPSPALPEEPSSTPAPAAPGLGRSDTRASWSQQVAQGDFAGVIQDAEQRGLDRTIAASSLDDLSALADAARYARRGSIAQRALLAERQRFPGSRPAREAAFFLGRLKEEEGGGGLEWYERYLSESPQGSYVPQALGRKMMLIYQQGGASAARPIADAYRERYPNGPYAAAARKIVGETESSKPNLQGTTRTRP